MKDQNQNNRKGIGGLLAVLAALVLIGGLGAAGWLYVERNPAVLTGPPAEQATEIETPAAAEEQAATEAEAPEAEEEAQGPEADLASGGTEEAADTTPPVISGVLNTALPYGSSFDVMAGIAVTDETDPAPSLTADVEAVDTDTYGKTHIIYTATDAAGNTATAERDVIVCEQVASYEGGSYPIHWDTAGREGQPYLVTVNRRYDTVTVYEQDADGRYTVPVKVFLCSTGYRTPGGFYITKERYRWRYLFEDSWGQYATRIDGHILFHSVPYERQDPSTLEYEEYNLLGTPASLGCIRLSVADVKWIYDNCPDGFPCVIYDDDLTPGPLGKPDLEQTDVNDERRGWDPTDPDPANPWHVDKNTGS